MNPMTIHFDCVEDAERYAEELESDCKAIQWALDNHAFDDAYTERIMRKDYDAKQAELDELWPLVLRLKFPLL